jgi:hypothetical protein
MGKGAELMNLSRNVIVLILLLAGLPALADPGWRLRFDGIGPLHVGMRFEEAGRALGRPLVPTRRELLATPGCDMVAVPGHKGVWLMFLDGVLKRIDVEGGARTVEGIGTGDPVQRAFASYAGVTSERHAYDDSERYLTVRSPNGATALRFETNEGKIGRFYAGEARAVAYVEGCL